MLACGTAQAAEWVSITKSADGKQEYVVDTSSIRVASDIRRAWFKTFFVPHSMQAPENPKKWWSAELSRDAFNCTEETHRNEAITIYYEDGTALVVPAETFPSPWAPVPPEAILDLEMKFLCAWKLK